MTILAANFLRFIIKSLKKLVNVIDPQTVNPDDFFHPWGYDDNNNNIFKEHVLEQYRIHVDLLKSIYEARDKYTKFMLILNPSIIAAIYTVMNNKVTNIDSLIIIIIILLIGLIINVSWFFIINSYENLLSAKYKILKIIETKLPYKFVTVEAELLKKNYITISWALKIMVALMIILIIIALGFFSYSRSGVIEEELYNHFWNIKNNGSAYDYFDYYSPYCF